MKRIALAILIAASAYITANAESMYISDKLVVSAYSEANQDSNKVTTLDSGDAVEAIEKVEGYTHVRLADNREGWIKSSYLSTQVPAIVRLKELEKEGSATAQAASVQVTAEIKQLKDQNAALESEVASLKQAASQVVTMAAPVPTPMTTVAAPQGRLEGEQTVRDDDQPSLLRYLEFGAGLVLVGSVLGFALGYQALARRIRRKYGSMKIY